MKKSLIALAALAAVSAASAQSSVTIGGLIDTGYAVVNAPAAASDTSGLKNNNTATTVLTIAGTEDLGGGNAAMFKMQLTPDFITGNGVGGGSSSALGGNSTTGVSQTVANNAQEVYLGLSSKTLGSIKLGRVNTSFLDAFSGTGSVFGTALGSAYSSSGNIGTRYAGTAVSTFNSAPTRFNQSIRYETPAFSGFSASLLVVPKIDNVGGADITTDATKPVATNRQGVTDIGLKYNNGPLNVVFASQTVKTGANGVVQAVSNTNTTALLSNVSNKLNIIAANYNFGATTVYGAFWTEKQDSATAMDASSTMVGVKYALNGTTTLMASYSTSNEKSTANVDKKILGLGADYALSKRTALYARYETRDANTNSSVDATATGTTKTTAFGIRHTF